MRVQRTRIKKKYEEEEEKGRKAGGIRCDLADKCNIDNTVDVSRRFRKRVGCFLPVSAILHLLFYFILRSVRRN